jgi:hypothetical protein
MGRLIDINAFCTKTINDKIFCIFFCKAFRNCFFNIIRKLQTSISNFIILLFINFYFYTAIYNLFKTYYLINSI